MILLNHTNEDTSVTSYSWSFSWAKLNGGSRICYWESICSISFGCLSILPSHTFFLQSNNSLIEGTQYDSWERTSHGRV